MKIAGSIVVAVSVFLMVAPAIAEARGGSRSSGGSHSVRGHTTRSGTYVAPHRATNPDTSRTNNWSARGNTNPNTGAPGTVDPLRR